MTLRWSYGVTTVHSRLETLLPRTLASLQVAGFEAPHLFVDGQADTQRNTYERFGLGTTVRSPKVYTAGNWLLSIYELYYRNPYAERYALFQDDLVTVRNLRQYLEAVPYPKDGYCNLYTFPENQAVAPPTAGWFEADCLRNPHGDPHPDRDQRGRSATALVFDWAALTTLLSSKFLAQRPRLCQTPHRKIDGGIVNAMNRAGFREYCHNPSLVQHTGDVSTTSNFAHPKAPSFPGEEFDALTLLSAAVL